MRTQEMLLPIGLFIALGGANVGAAKVAPANAIIMASDHETDHAIHDLGLLPVEASSGNSASTPSSVSTPNSTEATPIPELPTWAMMLLCLLGLGVAGLKKGRRNRLSPGIE